MEFDKKAFYKEVGLRLQLRRKRRGFTQEDVAARIGVPRATYANVESGRQSAALDLIWRAVAVLDARFDDIVPEALRTEAGKSAAGEPPIPATNAQLTVSLPRD